MLHYLKWSNSIIHGNDLIPDNETWPPADQPGNFIPLVLVHSQDRHCIKQDHITRTCDIDKITSLVSNQSVPKDHHKLVNSKVVQEVHDNGTITKEITNVLVTLEQPNDQQFILIEGAPGIGKSIFLKEIAYRWGNNQVLISFKLVLLVCLRDPVIQQASSFKDLLQLFCNREDTRTTKISDVCSNYFIQNGGKNLAFLFDGFDEYPEALLS